MLAQLFQRKSRSLLGIDISSSSVKLLQLSRAGSRYKVENYASRPLPEHAVVEKNIHVLDAVGETLYKLSALTRTAGGNAAVAVSGSAVITKTIELSASLSDAEMENQIIVEADQYIPYPLEEVAIDFERQRASPRNEAMVEVLLAACKKENVDLRVSALEIGGYRAKVVDIEAYAMERAYQLLKEQMSLPNHKLVAILDIGATMTTLYILLNGRSIFTREQLFGGLQLLTSLQGRYGLSRGEAENALRDNGLPPSYESEVLFPFTEEITEQVSRSLQFFFSSSQYNEVDLVVLAGGVASSTGLVEQVQESLATSTVVADPFAKMSVAPRVNKDMLVRESASAMMACGLALRGL